jgi:hypothetical protein
MAALRDALEARGVAFETGLSDAEFNRVEASYGFRFPPDLRSFLAVALPVSDPFPNWRDDTDEELRWRLDGPADGVAFDVEENDFWMEEWGQRPARVGEAAAIARAQMANAPKLVPVVGHRYVPSTPPIDGNPVFSVMQTDIVYAGNDLADYFANDFGAPRPPWTRSAPRQIELWSRLAEANG